MEKVVYTGGQHQILCDGKQHYQIDRWGRRIPDGKCWCKKETRQ